MTFDEAIKLGVPIRRPEGSELGQTSSWPKGWAWWEDRGTIQCGDYPNSAMYVSSTRPSSDFNDWYPLEGHEPKGQYQPKVRDGSGIAGASCALGFMKLTVFIIIW